MKLCLDIGATNIRSALIDKNYKIINKKIIKNPKIREEIINEVIQNEPKQLSYVNRNGGSFRINRI